MSPLSLQRHLCIITKKQSKLEGKINIRRGLCKFCTWRSTILVIQGSVLLLLYTFSMNILKVLAHTEDNIMTQRLYSMEDTELLQRT